MIQNGVTGSELEHLFEQIASGEPLQKGRDRKSTSTIINVDEVETYDGVADQCFIVARLTHDDVLEPQDFGRTIFVNTGDSRGGWHDISPFKAPVIIVRLLAERRECYLAVGGGWSRPV